MRLWSIHPGYLDSKGLVALWREGLLAQNVLRGQTQGYRNHPQLLRFRRTGHGEIAIAYYLWHVAAEVDKRNYNFDKKKLPDQRECGRISVTVGQVEYEFKWLLGKLQMRDPNRYQHLRSLKEIETHPLFVKIDGGIEDWEVVRQPTSAR